jgi:lysophospholipase L1-like esterase
LSADGSKNTDDIVANYYEKYCYTAADGFDGIKPQTIAYDHGFQPDAIVINLGTNDSTYTGTDPQRMGEYTEKYVEFLKTVRSKNPKARIFCTLGTMGNTLYNAMNDAVQRYTMLTGDRNITSFELPVQDQMLDGIVVQGHPSEKTHSKDADIIAQKIKTDMGW